MSSGAPAGGMDHRPAGLWTLAMRRLRADRIAMLSLGVVALFLAMLTLSLMGVVAAGWEEEVAATYAPPSFIGPDGLMRDLMRQGAGTAPTAPPANVFDPLAADIAAIIEEQGAAITAPPPPRLATLAFGADKWGHDVLLKTIKGGETSIVVGLAAALLAVALGTLFGAFSGYFGGVVDDLFNWLYNVFTSIPPILMILAVAAVLQHKGVTTIVLILGLTGWTGPYRLIRAEYMKHKGREYVMAADAIGASHWRKMFSHIFPNVSHVALVQLSILAVGFIKAEVILSFLGFGVPVGVVSWGSMLNEAQNELILGKWWQLTAAATAMALLVTAFSLLTDALRDALDPTLT
ncbi:ABC transporter permease [Massilia antarctica]|uniref:ABC transporter permease n=1 Tax=Massilia antarctica TaxID=2765360 RepID=A0AA48WII2_9BURK|nr:ABC transporter permease [Massilia antarctica]QPI52641.1 ABC transporter permease [Massilia antarctica]